MLERKDLERLKDSRPWNVLTANPSTSETVGNARATHRPLPSTIILPYVGEVFFGGQVSETTHRASSHWIRGAIFSKVDSGGLPTVQFSERRSRTNELDSAKSPSIPTVSGTSRPRRTTTQAPISTIANSVCETGAASAHVH